MMAGRGALLILHGIEIISSTGESLVGATGSICLIGSVLLDDDLEQRRDAPTVH
jgi:hypothetical protein